MSKAESFLKMFFPETNEKFVSDSSANKDLSKKLKKDFDGIWVLDAVPKGLKDWEKFIGAMGHFELNQFETLLWQMDSWKGTQADKEGIKQIAKQRGPSGFSTSTHFGLPSSDGKELDPDLKIKKSGSSVSIDDDGRVWKFSKK